MGTRGSDEPQAEHDPEAGQGEGPGVDPQVVRTNDPEINRGPRHRETWRDDPDATMVIETDRIHEPEHGCSPGIVIVPFEEKPASRPAQEERGNGPPQNNRSGNKDTEEDKDKKDTSSGNKKEAAVNKGNGENKTDKEDDSKAKKGENHQSRARDDGEDRPKGGDEDEHDHAQAQASSFPSMTRVLLYSGLMALVCGVVGAWGYSYFFGDKSKSKSSGDSSSSASSGEKKSSGGSSKESGSSKKNKGSDEEKTGSASNEADTIHGFTTAEDADSLRKQVGHLAERLDAMQQRVDSLKPSPEQTPLDLHTLQIKMVELARTVDDVASLPSRVRRMSMQLESLTQQLKEVKDHLTARDETGAEPPVVVVGGTATTPMMPAAVGTSTTLDVPDAALEQAMMLVKLGQYRLAENMLAKLRQTQPDDARVWYYSAITEGLTTGRWDGKAVDYVKKGIEREQEGTPSTLLIDQALKGLNRNQGNDWLAGYRSRIGKRS